MIIHIPKNISDQQANKLAQQTQSVLIPKKQYFVFVTSSKVKEVPVAFKEYSFEQFTFDTDIQLANYNYLKAKREIKIGDITFGGNTHNTLVITGPCSVESESQIRDSASLVKELGLSILRAGSFKPRTSPYSFQGLGIEGLKLLDKMREEFGLKIITEVRDASHVHDVIKYADIVQIGAKSMYDHGILRACGKARKPILLKRGFGTSLQEFVQASEFILSGGNDDVILCERGIRTFENKTRFTLDLCGVSYLKEYTNLPVIIDPSHAMGYAYGVADLSRASMAMNVDGLLIESHPNPKVAKSDASQQLDHDEFRELFQSLKKLSKVMELNIL